MTPQEIFEYKQCWMRSGNNNPVRLHSDLEDTGTQWCRAQLEPQQWNITRWSGVYDHTFYFEDIRAAQTFAMEFKRYVVDDFEIEHLDPDQRSWYYDSYGVKRKKNQ